MQNSWKTFKSWLTKGGSQKIHRPETKKLYNSRPKMKSEVKMPAQL